MVNAASNNDSWKGISKEERESWPPGMSEAFQKVAYPIATFGKPSYWPENIASLHIEQTATKVAISVKGGSKIVTLSIDGRKVTIIGHAAVELYDSKRNMIYGTNYSYGGELGNDSIDQSLALLLISVPEGELFKDEMGNVEQGVKKVLIQCPILNYSPPLPFMPNEMAYEHGRMTKLALDNATKRAQGLANEGARKRARMSTKSLN